MHPDYRDNQARELQGFGSDQTFGFVFMVFYFLFFGGMTLALWSYAFYRGLGLERVFATASIHDASGQSEAVGNFTVGALSPGALAYQSCVACHGSNGEGSALLKAPALNGLSEEYLVRQLEKFRNGSRGAHPDDLEGAIMKPMAAVLPNGDSLRVVAGYIEGLSSPPPPQTVVGNPEVGKVTFALCAACHGQDGAGNEILKAPSLLGLQDWYIRSSLLKFRSGSRAYETADIEGSQMRPMAMMITSDQALDDLIAYIAMLQVQNE